ncbi:MAG TPA: cytochrome b [Xanthobacteraceae bacterium]|jgi:cytochrome b561|nr:cytochrome b [Xanthobacteraceae bacterium]
MLDMTNAKGRFEIPAYTRLARTFHWVTAALVLTLIPVGIVMARVSGGPLQDWLFNFHRSLGAVLVPLMVVRAVYRLAHPPLPLPSEIPAAQKMVAESVHGMLYALLTIQPMIGWISVSAYRAPMIVFGLFELPPVWREDRLFSEQMSTIHTYVGFALAALLCAHIGGALFHHFIQRDRVLMRMISGR